MKELRSAVNAFFLFSVFLLLHALFVPGPPGGGRPGAPPRFLRMVIEEGTSGHGRNRASISIPHFLVRGGLAMSGVGRLQRELDRNFHEGMEVEELRGLVAELKERPEGQTVTRTHEDTRIDVKRDGAMAVFTMSEEKPKAEAGEGEKDEGGDEGTKTEPPVVLKVPFRFLEALAAGEKPLDVQALVEAIKHAGRGDVVDLLAEDVHIRVYLD